MVFRDNIIVCALLLPCLSPATATHNQWWRCSAECKRCDRKMMRLDNPIRELYTGLFSSQPPESPQSSPYVYSRANRISSRNAMWLYRSSNRSTGHNERYHATRLNSCCETETSHIVLNTIDYMGYNYTVVHLKDAYQFIPVGRCGSTATCGKGTCFQRYRPHRVLVYNSRRSPNAGPLIFLPKDVPSHCECRNIIPLWT